MVWSEPETCVRAQGALRGVGPLALGLLCALGALRPGSAKAAAPEAALHEDSSGSDEATAKTASGVPAGGKLRYQLDRVELRGNTKTQDSVVMRFIPFRAGDVLDVDDPRLLLTQYRLLSTGLYHDVTLSLSRGHQPGHVVLNVDIAERNTLVVNSLWLGVAATADTHGEKQNLSTFAGLDVAENNLLGTGIALGSAVVFSADQFAGTLHLSVPPPLDKSWMLAGEVRYLSGLGYFGNSEVRWDGPELGSAPHRQAVVAYQRMGATLNLGLELDQSLQLWLGYRFDGVLSQLPLAASHRYGGEIEPIDFHVATGTSYLSAAKASLTYDTRDRPYLTRAGWRAAFSAEAALPPLGSTYSYQKLDLFAAHWWPLSSSQALMLSGLAGAIAGRAPFFEQYYIGDLSDLLPSRILGLAFDDRPAPNVLGTSIADVRYGDYAARVNLEYSLSLFRGAKSIYGVDAFINAGVLSLATSRNFIRPPRNRSGFAAVPIDLTANLGVRLDTSLGAFTLSLSNTIGFLLSRGSRE